VTRNNGWVFKFNDEEWCFVIIGLVVQKYSMVVVNSDSKHIPLESYAMTGSWESDKRPRHVGVRRSTDEPFCPSNQT